MFMQRIDVPVAEAVKPMRVGHKIAAGLLFMLFAAAIMPPYLVAVLLWVAVAAAGRTLLTAAKTACETVLYAGEVIVGR